MTPRQSMLAHAAKIVNESKTGAVAKLREGYVSVQVPGIGYVDGKTVQIFTEENVYSVQGALSLIHSMQ